MVEILESMILVEILLLLNYSYGDCTMSTLITNTLQGVNTIKRDASTTAMTIDSTGRVTTYKTNLFFMFILMKVIQLRLM